MEAQAPGLAGLPCKQHMPGAGVSQPGAGLSRSGPLPRPLGRSHLHPQPAHTPAVRPARARLPAPQEAEAQARSRRRSPRFCPRSTAYGRLCSSGSTGLGAFARPTRRAHRPRHSHHHTARSILPSSQPQSPLPPEAPPPSPLAQPLPSLLPLGRRVVARVTIVPPPPGREPIYTGPGFLNFILIFRDKTIIINNPASPSLHDYQLVWIVAVAPLLNCFPPDLHPHPLRLLCSSRRRQCHPVKRKVRPCSASWKLPGGSPFGSE